MVDSVKQSGAIRSPFVGHQLGILADRFGNVGVEIRAGTLQSVHLIATWCSGLPGLVQALTGIFNDLPGPTGTTRETPWGLLLRTGPEEFLLIGSGNEDMTTQLRGAIEAGVGSVTDLSHARCYIHVSGVQCRSVMGKLFALDLRETEFPVGQIRLTGTHHVPCILHRLGPDTFRIFVFTTYAYDQLSTVMDAAREYGVSLTAVA